MKSNKKAEKFLNALDEQVRNAKQAAPDDNLPMTGKELRDERLADELKGR